MLPLLKRILSARAIAAAISLLANMAAVVLLPGVDYAAASVAISVAAIALPLFYQPFSKYVLISGRPEDVESIFWTLQPLVAVILLLGACAWWLLSVGVAPTLAAAAAVFALSQGWKEFGGELARSRGDIPAMQRLYVLDAVTTTTATVLALPIFRHAEVFLLCSAVSSIFWSWRLMLRQQYARTRVDVGAVLSIYRYSYGVVGTSSLNAATIAIARNAILHASPPAVSGAIQFVLDLLQKPMALIGSSITTAVLPEARKKPIDGVLLQLAAIMTASLLCLLLLACLVSLLPPDVVDGSATLGIPLLLTCAVFVWSNRYKSSVMDIPLLASTEFVSRLTFGSGIALVLMWIVSRVGLPPASTLVTSSAVLVSGGVISLLAARNAKLVKGLGVIQTCTAPVLVIVLATLLIT